MNVKLVLISNKGQLDGLPRHPLHSMTHDSRAREERFVRLAVLASQWSDSVDTSWDEMGISDGSCANLSDVEDRPSPRELLQRESGRWNGRVVLTWLIASTVADR